MPKMGTPRLNTFLFTRRALFSERFCGPPDKIMPRPSASRSSGKSGLTSSAKTPASRMRLVIKCEYWEPKSKTYIISFIFLIISYIYRTKNKNPPDPGRGDFLLFLFFLLCLFRLFYVLAVRVVSFTHKILQVN